MVFLESNSTNPYFNLALEEFVFEQMDQSKQYFMLWQNDNTIVVGKYQNTAEEINQAVVRQRGIRVARRLSGGGAVYHDKGNLNFTFITDQKQNPEFDFKLFIQPVVRTLEKLGVRAEFNGRNDITIDGRKFSGNSQYAKHGRLLHHGCIMLDSNLTDVADALRVKEAKFDSKSVKSVRSRVTTINENAPRRITMEEFKRALYANVDASVGLERYELTRAELAEVERLRREKYETWAWNYGSSPAFQMRVEKKFPAGLVTACVRAEGGAIREIRFYGDFFGNGEISELERSLVGLKLDETLERCLRERDVGYYLSGISAEDLAGMLM